MTELEEAIMKKDSEPDVPEEEEQETETAELSELEKAEIVEIIEGGQTAVTAVASGTDATPGTTGELPETVRLEPEYEPEELIRESSDAVRRMTKEVQQENELLEISFSKTQTAVGEGRTRRKAPRRRYVYVGTLSAALSLIVMGVATTVSLFSPEGILGAFKIAPLMLVFLGLETLLAVVSNRSVRLHFSVKSLIVTVLLIALTFAMSLISVSNSVTGGERVHAEKRLHNMLAREIKDRIPSDNISGVDIELMLYGEDPAQYYDISDLQEGDCANISVRYSQLQESVLEFAEDCREIMDALEKVNCCFDKVAFTADNGSRYSLSLDWLYQSELTAQELIPLVGYYGEDISLDIPDIVDEEK